MQLKIISQLAKNLGGVVSKNSPTILTTLGVGGLLTTVIFAIKATPKAMEVIEDELYARNQVLRGAELSFLDKVKVAWKLYIPTAAMGVVTTACIIGSNSINQSRNAALATVYGLTEVAFREYKEKVVDNIGRNKELKIRDDIAGDRVANNPVGDRTIIITGNGEVLCYDALCDRYFNSSAEKIRQQVLDLNEDLRTEMATWADLNDLYYAIGLPPTILGRKMGFDMNKGYIMLQYTSTLTPEMQPCLSIEATVYPNPRYMK